MRHYILLSSSYSIGTRIAMDFVDDHDTFEYIARKIKAECGRDISLAIHSIESPSTSWQSIVDYDCFFEGVKLIDTVEEFIFLINQDRKLTSLSLARYILSQIECTHLKLEKLVYLCYADYLCTTEKRLFDDIIYAFHYGPVVSSVYEKYKKFDKRVINNITKDKETSLAFKSLITFTDDGYRKLRCIDNIIKRFGDYSAFELVELTHVSESPWDLIYDGSEYKEIPDCVIKAFHNNEVKYSV